MINCILNSQSDLNNSLNSNRSFTKSFMISLLMVLSAFLGNSSFAQANETVSCLEDVTLPELEADLECDLVSENLFSSETGEPTSECVFSTAFGAGDDWALWIPNQDGLGSDDFIPSTELSFVQYADGTANLTGQVVNTENDQEIFNLDFWFQNASAWSEWQPQGRYYKDDAGVAGNNFMDWTYYELVAGISTATGSGDLADDILYFSHNPADYFFGFQLGEAANNKNENLGFSGWFNYTGTLYGEAVEGNGDINADASCTPLATEGCVHDTEFTYIYTATDECGTIYVEEYVIEVIDEIAPVFVDGPTDMTINCQDWPMPLADCLAEDNCEGEVTYVTPTETIEEGACPSELIVTRTWGAIDVCGNQTTHTQVITVVDVEAPVFSGLPAEEVTAECDAVPAAADVIATDNCSEFELSYSELSVEGDCPNNYTLTRTWLVEDACGNADSFTQTITIEDTEAPSIALPVITTVECDASDALYASATDNCSDSQDIVIEYTDVLNSGGCMGVLERVYTATDECGNSSVATQYITLTDTTAPVLECADDATYECDVQIPTAQEDAPEATDNCTEVTLSLEETSTGDSCETVITRTWTATDYCGNETTCTQIITVVDTTNPAFTSFPADFIHPCNEEIPAVEMPTADDNCQDVTISLTSEEEVSGECDGESTITRIFRAEDGCGNFVIGIQTITIIDEIAPEFTSVPADLTLECTEDVPADVATAEDSCSDVTLISTDVESGDSCELVITRTFTATDACGNMSTAEQIITILDTEAPTFEGPTSLDMPCDVEIPNTSISASDLCNDVTLEFTDQMVSGGCAGQIIRTFTATDACGNAAEMEQIIDLFDNAAPEFTSFPIDLSVECDVIAPISEAIDAEDNCGDVTIAYEGEVIVNGDCPNNYTIIRTWSATDECNNGTTQSQTITVSDTTAPTVTAPEDLTHQCTESPEYGDALATDNCSEVIITVTEETEGDSCEQTITRTFTATDACGNSSEATQIITILDEVDPIFTFVPEDLSHECDESPVYGMAEGDDACSTASVTVSEEMSGDDCETILMRTFTLTDACGNSVQATQVITIVDTTAPVITGEIAFSMPCDEIDTNIELTVTDNCNAYTLSHSDVTVSGGCAGQIIRTCVATDACGNVSEEFTQIIDLIDETAPVAENVPANLELECTEEVIFSEPVFTDNCDDELSVVFDETSTGDSCDSLITRTWIATDHCGNEAIIEQLISITDSEAPAFTNVPANLSHSCDENPAYGMATAEDACNEATVSISEITSGDSCNSTITRTFTATDACGNSATATQVITITDEDAPEFTSIPANLTHACDESPAYGMATAEDNCNDVTVAVSVSILSEDACETVIERTFTASDACGNADTASQIITIVDTEAPTFDNMPSDLTVQCTAPAMAEVTASDNCSQATVSSTMLEDIDECGNGTVTYTFTAVDECGNTAQPISYTITIEDTTDPVLSGAPSDLILDCEDEVPAMVELTATDNCDSNVTVEYSEVLSGNVPAEGSIADCVLSTPAGATCDNNEAWSLRLFSFPNYEFFSTVSASLVEYPDGTAVIEGTLVANNNPDAFFDIYVELENGMDWDAWSNQTFPTSYKDDCEAVTDEFEDWTYYIINADAATLTGDGVLAGSEFNLTQAPSNFFYGYQVGTSANNVNQNAGNGGWFTANGTLVDSDNQIDQELTGISGDFAFDADCCPQYSVERTWTATDCSGNSTSFTQTITFEDLEDVIETPSIEVASTDVIANTSFSTKVYPNPVVGNANFEFKSYINDKVEVEVYSVDGTKLATVFSGDVEAELTYTYEFSTVELNSGLYIFKVTGRNGISTEKFVVTK